MHVIHKGFCDVRPSKLINVTWALTLLQVAVWSQVKLSKKCVTEGSLESNAAMSSTSHAALRRCLGNNFDSDTVPVLIMAIVGAAGTGKTAVLKIIQPFADVWLGIESVLKSAPTNTASRVFGGDTCHALYKLPFGTLKSRRGKLTGPILQSYGPRFRNVRLQNIDEVGMLPPSSLHQIEVRRRTAPRDIHSMFGGLST